MPSNNESKPRSGIDNVYRRKYIYTPAWLIGANFRREEPIIEMAARAIWFDKPTSSLPASALSFKKFAKYTGNRELSVIKGECIHSKNWLVGTWSESILFILARWRSFIPRLIVDEEYKNYSSYYSDIRELTPAIINTREWFFRWFFKLNSG